MMQRVAGTDGRIAVIKMARDVKIPLVKLRVRASKKMFEGDSGLGTFHGVRLLLVEPRVSWTKPSKRVLKGL
jgi:hypothetical protein